MEQPDLESIGINDLTPQCLQHIFSFLDAKECAVAAAVQRLWRTTCLDDLVWKAYLLQDYLENAPQTPSGQVTGTFREAYANWAREFPGEYKVFVRRAVGAWRGIKAWLSQHRIEIVATLRPGATEEQLIAAETTLQRKLPYALRAMYRIHDGQDLLYETSRSRGNDDVRQSIFLGLFGGYAFYDHLVCVRMLSLEKAVELTGQMLERGVLPPGAKAMAFAANWNYQKLFTVDLATGMLRVHKVNWQTVNAAPPDPTPGSNDGVLRWFEEYCARLTNDTYEIAALDEDHPQYRAICLFPMQPPLMEVAVMRGVRVRASALYVPERSRDTDLYTYSIRFSLLPTEQQADHWPHTAGPFRPLHACQLLTRHWIIRGPNDEVVDEVEGDGVIGKYPLLRPGHPEFVYQSCTYQRTASGSMEGSFGFVEGSQQAPTGGEWNVLCPRFRLAVPDYVF